MDDDLLLELSNKILNTMPTINRKIFNMTSMMKDCTLPLSHMQVILYLSKRESSSVSEIAKVLGISRPNMTPIIDKLINENLVERNVDSTDRRVIRVNLTSNAKGFMAKHQQKVSRSLAEKLSALNNEDLITLQDSLTTLANIVNKI
ncbi:MAG: MarR family winged helix-turn-helix transcriptional regulator [Clostridium sp.]